MRLFLFTVFFTILCLQAFSQKIANKDLDGFVAFYDYEYDKVERKYSIDYAELKKWKVLSSDSVKRRKFDDFFDPKKEIALILANREQNSKIENHCDWWSQAQAYNNYRFFLMRDGSRWGDNNTLAIWNQFQRDSLEFVCAYSAPTIYKVEKISFFPDSSLLIVLAGGGGDTDHVDGWYRFLRAKTDPCILEDIYSSNWKKRAWDKVNTYVFYNIECPVREITEVTEYSTPVFKSLRGWVYNSTDSASAKVIDLWGKVQEMDDNPVKK